MKVVGVWCLPARIYKNHLQPQLSSFQPELSSIPSLTGANMADGLKNRKSDHQGVEDASSPIWMATKTYSYRS